MRTFWGVFELFSRFAEAFVSTFPTSSTDRILTMHSLAPLVKPSIAIQTAKYGKNVTAIIMMMTQLKTVTKRMLAVWKMRS